MLTKVIKLRWTILIISTRGNRKISYQKTLLPYEFLRTRLSIRDNNRKVSKVIR